MKVDWASRETAVLRVFDALAAARLQRLTPYRRFVPASLIAEAMAPVGRQERYAALPVLGPAQVRTTLARLEEQGWLRRRKTAAGWPSRRQEYAVPRPNRHGVVAEG